MSSTTAGHNLGPGTEAPWTTDQTTSNHVKPRHTQMPAGISTGKNKFIGPGTEAPWINLKLAPGTTDQTTALSFQKSLNDVLALNFFFDSPNLIWFFMALAIHTFNPYDIAGTLTTSATTWFLSRFAMNYCVAFVYYGFFHYGLYVARWGKRKFVEGSYPSAGNMLHNLYYWSLGIVQWTFWEYVMCKIWATDQGAGYVSNNEILNSKSLFAWNVFWFLAIPVWRDLHFYIAHRFIHIRAIYKYVHSLHHRNNDPEPFSGMTMHTVEHLYYFSNAFTPSLFVSGLSPMVFLWNFIHLTIAPGAGHSGFEDNFQADQYHFVHHAKFECNYGSPFSAFIDQYFGTFREKLGKSVKYTGEYKNDYEETNETIHSSSKIAEKKNTEGKQKNTTRKQMNKSAVTWSAKGYLGVPESWSHGVYSMYWVALFSFAWWSVTLKDVRVKEWQGIPIEIVCGSVVAYSPVVVALLLARCSGDKKSWRWPFQKEKVFGPFGLFLMLGWLACVLPVYYATKAACSIPR